MATPEEPAVRRAPRWMKILLTGSLAVNLLVVGVVAGAAWRFSKAPQGGGGPRDGFAVIAALERDDRRAVLKELRQEGRQARAQARDDMARLLDVLRSPTLDPDALDALMLSQITRGKTMQDTVRAAWSARVTAMSAQERAAYADRLEYRLKASRKRGLKPREGS